MTADTDEADAARAETLARLAHSRAELKRLIEAETRPAGAGHGGGGTASGAGGRGFPRSRTMRALLSGKGLGTVGALAGGLLVTRPALVLRLLRMVPAAPIARALLVKAITALRSGNKS